MTWQILKHTQSQHTLKFQVDDVDSQGMEEFKTAKNRVKKLSGSTSVFCIVDCRITGMPTEELQLFTTIREYHVVSMMQPTIVYIRKRIEL